ncbi:MAG: hypothetical protein H6736_17005 [Alphaproteobacteria bacterium]|nr:hypothetical protein [Alphaproteobacteria bacterium]MCB9693513.1 hypothetical protein [Alphaproteobacteria bacterium]
MLTARLQEHHPGLSVQITTGTDAYGLVIQPDTPEHLAQAEALVRQAPAVDGWTVDMGSAAPMAGVMVGDGSGRRFEVRLEDVTAAVIATADKVRIVLRWNRDFDHREDRHLYDAAAEAVVAQVMGRVSSCRAPCSPRSTRGPWRPSRSSGKLR